MEPSAVSESVAVKSVKAICFVLSSLLADNVKFIVIGPLIYPLGFGLHSPSENADMLMFRGYNVCFFFMHIL